VPVAFVDEEIVGPVEDGVPAVSAAGAARCAAAATESAAAFLSLGLLVAKSPESVRALAEFVAAPVRPAAVSVASTAVFTLPSWSATALNSAAVVAFAPLAIAELIESGELLPSEGAPATEPLPAADWLTAPVAAAVSADAAALDKPSAVMAFAADVSCSVAEAWVPPVFSDWFVWEGALLAAASCAVRARLKTSTSPLGATTGWLESTEAADPFVLSVLSVPD
jgi:hypothetical protein